MSHEVFSAFREAAAARGLELPADIQADGKIHRCGTTEKPKSKNGSYKLHLDNRPAGGFQNLADGLPWENWKADADPSRMLPRRELRERMETDRAKREADALARQERAAALANEVWAAAVAAPADHPYLVRKHIQPIGVRLEVATGALVVPLSPGPGGFTSLQRIFPDGSKKFLSGGRIKGCARRLGQASVDGDLIAVAEGYATGVSVHMATGWTVVCAMSAGNLRDVVAALRVRFPRSTVLVAADNDRFTAGNPGQAAALKSDSHGIITPSFGGDSVGTDWNDLHVERGLVEVTRQLQRGLELDGLGVSVVDGSVLR